MDYKNIYDKLIEKARFENRQKYKGVYYEAHHIQPLCLGGEGKASDWRHHKNIVLLTAKEHFLAHLLLCEIHPNENSLIQALYAMSTYKNKYRKRDLSVSSRVYERARTQFSEMNSKNKKGNKNRLGIKFSKESIDKIRIAQLGTKQDIAQCPYCLKEGGSRAMKQYHFDNCKKKPGNENIQRTTKYKQPRYTCPYCKKYNNTKNNLEKWHIKTCNERPNKPPKKVDVSPETNKKRSDTMKGKNTAPHKKVQCPHCDKVGGHSVMMRHHFNNCKYKV